MTEYGRPVMVGTLTREQWADPLAPWTAEAAAAVEADIAAAAAEHGFDPAKAQRVALRGDVPGMPTLFSWGWYLDTDEEGP